jgi:quercetin dioxygenase-like cupin family protein
MLEQTTQPVHVSPGAGDTVFLLGDTYTTLLSGAQTGGTFALLEALVPAHTGPPPHIHHAEDETFTLLEGVLDFHVGDDVHRAEPSSVIFVPRGTRHHFSNVGDSLARMLFMYSPAGMEGMFAEIGAPGRRGTQAPPLSASDVEALTGVAEKYRFSIVAD